jgi:NAD(P)-dependent dehydrogenase (short-subunit alcohol dehydrogenase family)
MTRFADKVVLVTGGNSGIGRATAVAFAAEGASVMIGARDLDRSALVVHEITRLGGVADAVHCDVTRQADCDAAVAATVERYGPPFDVNTRGTFLMSKAALAVMIERGGGVIINNASYFGLVGGRGTAAYSASKGAVVLLTKAMALDHAPDGIRVNCVCAGSVDTPMLQGEMEEMGGADAVRHLFEQKHPLGRIASPDEIAQAVLYLASDDAAFVTGAALPVDGGLTAG